MRTLIIIFYLGTISSFAQTNIFDQDYYAVIKNKTIKFEQKKDTIFITNCNDFEKCDSLSKSALLIGKVSTINTKTRKIILKNLDSNVNPNSEVFQEKIITITEYKNGRKAIDENYGNHRNNKIQLAILYPKSELMKLEPISKITEWESKEILEEFTEYIKSIDKAKFDYDDFANWEKFNDLVIKRGYNPIGAELEIGKKTK